MWYTSKFLRVFKQKNINRYICDINHSFEIMENNIMFTFTLLRKKVVRTVPPCTKKYHFYYERWLWFWIFNMRHKKPFKNLNGFLVYIRNVCWIYLIHSPSVNLACTVNDVFLVPNTYTELISSSSTEISTLSDDVIIWKSILGVLEHL